MASEKPVELMDDDESIKVLYEGKEPIRADIVFVHGLTGNGIGTWQKGDIVWPRDLLPKAVPACRVITWNYDADIMRFFNKTGQNTILKHAENFLLDLAGMRDEEDGVDPDRPIIFVGHSLGGLVIKQALITAREHEHTLSEDDEYAKILRNTVGIVFLGTPHRGSDQQKWDGIATNLAKILKKDHNDTIVNALSRGSSVLEGLQSSFAGISDRFTYATFSEEREYPNIGKIVDDESAIMYLTKEDRASIPANHLGMSRFGSVNETGFKRIVIAVKARLRAAAMRDPIRHNSTPSLTGYGGPAMPPAQAYPPVYGRYPSDRGGGFYNPGYFPPGGGYPPGYGRPGFSPYGSPDLDDRGLPIMLDRVSIAPSMSDADTVVGTSPRSSVTQLAPTITARDPVAEQSKEEVHQDVPDTVADKVATGEDAAPQEETAEEEAEEEEQAPPVPSPITRDMYIRLVQEFTDKEKAPDEEFQGGISRIKFYRKRVVKRLYLERAKAQIEAKESLSDDVISEIKSRPYSAGLYCNNCSESPPELNHCIICEGGDYDLCPACVDKGVKCPGNHPLVKVTKATDENADVPLTPEEESLFPVDDLENFDADNQECIIRALYLAALLGGHDEIIASIVQYDTDSDNDVNLPPDFGTSRLRLTPLAMAILMGRDDNVSTLLNAQPNMLVWNETVNPEVEGGEDQRGTEAEASAQEESTTEGETEGTTEGEGSEDSESFDGTVTEDVAIEAIRLACSHGNAQTTKILLLQWGQDPLPKEHYLLHDAAEFGHTESVDILINWGADVEEQRPDFNRTPLVHSAWLNTDIAKVETLLRRRANVNAQDKFSKTALHYASVNNRLDIVQKLLDEKANLEIEDNDGNTPIHFVVEQPEHYAIAKLMVQKGASLKHKNKKGIDPLDLAVESKAENGETYMMLAGGKVSRWWSKKMGKK